MATYQGPIKDFYSLQEFYSFIRQDDNTPSGHRHFTLVPFIANPCNKNGITDPVITRLFTTNNLRKFQLCVQKISLPNFTLNSGDIKGTLSNSTPLGVWQTVDNTTIFPDKNTFQITLLDTMDPIIERFIYPWYVECLRTKNSLSSAYPFPRLNFAIKYYREDRVRQNMNGIKPNFVYWIEGVYPSTVEACTIDHKLDTGGGEIFRAITFTFNMISAFSSEEDAKYYHHEELFSAIVDNTVQTNTTSGKDLYDKLTSFITWKKAFYNFTSYLPPKINKSVSNNTVSTTAKTINPVDSNRNNITTRKPLSSIDYILTDIERRNHNILLTTLEEDKKPNLNNINKLFLNNNQVLHDINTPNNTILTSTPLEDKTNDVIIKNNLNNALNDLAKSEEIYLPSNTDEKSKAIQILNKISGQQSNSNIDTNLNKNSDIINNFKDKNPIDIYTNNNSGKNNPTTVSNTTYDLLNLNTTKSSINQTEKQLSVEESVNKYLGTDNLKITSTEYNLIKSYVQKQNTTTSKVISDLKTLTGSEKTNLLNKIIEANTADIQKSNQIISNNISAQTNTNQIIDTNLTDITTRNNITNAISNAINDIEMNIRKSNINTNNINNAISDTINDIEMNMKKSNINTNNINDAISDTINNMEMNMRKSDININTIVENILDEILKTQRKSTYNILDYKKQVQTAMELLERKQRQTTNNINISTQLARSLELINRKQAKKLTDAEIQLFIKTLVRNIE